MCSDFAGPRLVGLRPSPAASCPWPGSGFALYSMPRPPAVHRARIAAVQGGFLHTPQRSSRIGLADHMRQRFALRSTFACAICFAAYAYLQ